MAAIAVQAPANAIVELGGPEYLPFEDFILTALTHHRDPRVVVTEANARYFGTPPEQRILVTDDTAERGVIRYGDWLAPGSS